MASTTKAFGIPEILMLILQHLPLIDLIVVLRVSKTWWKTIDNSSALKENLFLTGKNSKELVWNPLVFQGTQTRIGSRQFDNFRRIDHGILEKICQSPGPWKHMRVTQTPVTKGLLVEETFWNPSKVLQTAPMFGEWPMRLEDVQKLIAQPLYKSGANMEVKPVKDQGPSTRYYGLAILPESTEIVTGMPKTMHMHITL